MTIDKDSNGAARPRHPMIPLRKGVLLPGSVMTLPVGRPRSVAALQRLKVGALVVLGIQRDPRVDDPELAELHGIGTLGRIQRIRPLENGSFSVMLEGLYRVRLAGLHSVEGYWSVEVDELQDRGGDDPESLALADALRQRVQELVGNESGNLAQAVSSPALAGILADKVAAALDMDTERELEVLETLDVNTRIHLVARRVNEAKALHDIKQKVNEEVRRGLSKQQRDALLREQIRALHKELGEEDSDDRKRDALREKLSALELPEEARDVVERELKRLESIPAQHPEANVARTYLELIADLPWDKRAEARLEIDEISAKLEADHKGLDEVKKRILEHMAVRKLTGNAKGTILCFAGPPGVGKTSLGQSIADATGRPFHRIALGGVRDEAEIRGHRRTYVGAIPGRVVSALRKLKVKNPVILLDEVDKLTHGGWSGNPEAALLELLDPEQNKSFTDHYLELPFDLSEVMFVCTANDLGGLSAPLRDRLEIIEISGYTPDEKVAIARSHLLPRQMTDHALTDELVEVTDAALDAIVRDYTRESGVRQLNREISKICRGVALAVARSSDVKPQRVRVDVVDLHGYLGKVKFFSEVAERTAVAGVATGMAWTPVGGDILFIETSRMPGKGNLQITGQLGDVMKESAKAAMTYVRSNAEVLGVDPAFLDNSDIHIHVPAGAVPKDGPSAGVTIFTALTSLLTGRRVRSDTAMTGECTLRGRVLPVGGIKSKVLAAHRSGLTRVILPKKNERDVDEIPPAVAQALEIIFAEDMSEVLQGALEARADGEPVASSGLQDRFSDVPHGA